MTTTHCDLCELPLFDCVCNALTFDETKLWMEHNEHEATIDEIRTWARQIAAFHTTLVEHGVDSSEATDLTHHWMESRDFDAVIDDPDDDSESETPA